MRCMKPSDAIGEPILIVFSDASQDAYAACAYVRWKLQNGQFESNLILSKNRLPPIKKISIDRIDLCGAVLNKRLKTFIEKECRYRFQRIYHIVDSQIVHVMIQKNSYGFNTFAATRIGEIQEKTSQTDWYWVESEHNIADCLTRGKKPNDRARKHMAESTRIPKTTRRRVANNSQLFRTTTTRTSQDGDGYKYRKISRYPCRRN